MCNCFQVRSFYQSFVSSRIYINVILNFYLKDQERIDCCISQNNPKPSIIIKNLLYFSKSHKIYNLINLNLHHCDFYHVTLMRMHKEHKKLTEQFLLLKKRIIVVHFDPLDRTCRLQRRKNKRSPKGERRLTEERRCFHVGNE